MNAYLRRQAGQHQRDGIAAAHVLVDPEAPARIPGYVSLSAAQAELDDLASADRKRPPNYPVPAIRVGRLAVADASRTKGCGDLLFGHSVNTALRLRSELGVRLPIVDALDQRVAGLCHAYGFRATASRELALYLPLGRRDPAPWQPRAFLPLRQTQGSASGSGNRKPLRHRRESPETHWSSPSRSSDSERRRPDPDRAVAQRGTTGLETDHNPR